VAIPSSYDIEWTSQSRHAGESMPVGGYDTGLNVWVEQGELLFYIGRSGCLDENNQLLKLGRIRLTFDPNPLAEQAKFQQALRLQDGRIEIKGRCSDMEILLQIWAETHRPVIHVEATASAGLVMTAGYETWRTAPRELSAAAKMAAVSWYTYPGQVLTQPDHVQMLADRVVFYHRNHPDELLFDRLVEQQGLTSIKSKLWNPQRNLLFGGAMLGEGMVPSGIGNGCYAGTAYQSYRLVSEQAMQRHHLMVCLHTVRCENTEAWHLGLQELCEHAATDRDDSDRLALQWWHAYWERSYVVVKDDRQNGRADAVGSSRAAWNIGRNYQLFRYMLGCNACGEAPTKFNGGLFTVDPDYTDPALSGAGPDYRRWGGGSMVAQNQRLVYWPMLKSGDFGMMKPQFELYRQALGNAEARTQYYWGHDGCSFAEQVENFGLPIGWGWGWDHTADATHTRPRLFDATELIGPWIRYQYSGQLEWSYMMLQYARYSQDGIEEYLPFIESAVRFYDEHYQWRHEVNTTHRLDEQGRLVIFPSTACETYKDAANPTDVLAGLRAVVDALLELPEIRTNMARKTYYEQLLGRIPPIAYREREGRRLIAPAHYWSHKINCELPQLYPVFPYDRIAIGDEQLQTAIDTWHYGADAPDQKNHVSWHQDPIFCARLGLTDEAANNVRLKLEDGNMRFPAFWGEDGHDWLPDHNWGGSGMIALQEMLLQCIGSRLLLFPAWPRSWDVRFKLHAAFGTTVEAEWKEGRLASLKVTPEHRMSDIVNMLESTATTNTNVKGGSL